ncbi:DUF6053 domain-containing protein [Lysobacter sp. CA199]|uniref:DUF6053 domain-containing protein n=1 Tax=Lysobacter sp. CA199 TaxID=3455608 RepID=UPI003F8D653A
MFLQLAATGPKSVGAEAPPTKVDGLALWLACPIDQAVGGRGAARRRVLREVVNELGRLPDRTGCARSFVGGA